MSGSNGGLMVDLNGQDAGGWAHQAVRQAVAHLTPCADPDRAAKMSAYMKHVAPFLGVQAEQRRRALRCAWSGTATPTSDELGHTTRLLMTLDAREFHYAAYDLIDRSIDAADAHFLEAHVEALLTTKPWWDTVDGLGTAAVSPLCRRHESRLVIDRWSESGNTWLIRAAIQHQRGWKQDTDIGRVLELCDRHWESDEFFIARAVGWALRDVARLDAKAVERFLATRQTSNTIAAREARRGLEARPP